MDRTTGKKRAAAERDTKALIKTIRRFCKDYGIAESTFGRHAVNDGKFVSRISAGSWIAPETEARLYDFMDRVESGEVTLRGRPRRKKDASNAETMAALISTETSVRTAGSFAFHEQRQRFHVFANTTNESWVVADRVADDLSGLSPGPDGIRLLYTPMDNGIILARTMRALHAMFPETPVLVVMKGRGLEDLRNTMGRLVDRLTEHPLSVFVMTNMYLNEAVDLTKRSDDNPADPVWRDVALTGDLSYDFQGQIATLYSDLSKEWLVYPGAHGQPVYAKPSVVTIYRKDRAAALAGFIPKPGATDLAYDYALLNHPYLHSHTMRFRLDYTLNPVLETLRPGGTMTVIQSQGDDPAHEIVRAVWPDKPLTTVSRYEVIKALRRSLGDRQAACTFRGLTDAQSLFRFDMHTLPLTPGRDLGFLTLSSAWNNALYFVQVKEELAQAAMQKGSDYLDVTAEVLRRNGGLWFVNETFSVTRKAD